MKRTRTALWSLAAAVAAMAIISGSAAATTGYEWLNQKGDSAAGSAPSQPPSDYSSINATLNGADTQPAVSPVEGTAFRSVNSIVGSQPVPEETVTVVHDGAGFSWGDAFIGAGAALVLMLISVITVYEVRRHGRVTVATRA